MSVKLLYGMDVIDGLKTLADESVHCVVTSPPYWGLRTYGVDGQMGLEKTPEEYVSKIVEVFREVKRVLREDGTLWLNLGDSYWGGGFGTSPNGNEDFAKRYPKQASNKGTADHETRKQLGILKKGNFLKPKDMVGIPWRVAFTLQNDGWYLRSDIIWAKPNPMPESVTDRPTKSYEHVFLLTKSERYFYDRIAVLEEAAYDGRKDTVMKGSEKYDGVQENASRGHERWRKMPRKNDGTGHAGDGTNVREHSGCSMNNPDYAMMRNKRDVWMIPTESYRGAHFATFPAALVEPCILAGTSAMGCCGKCGKSVKRMIKTLGVGKKVTPGSKTERKIEIGLRTAIGGAERDCAVVETLGWEPQCKCNVETVRCVVLDPFGGSGTVGEVAAKLGRDAILIDLNKAYEPLARERIGLLV